MIAFANNSYSQKAALTSNYTVTPQGILENISDQYGNRYILPEIQINSQQYGPSVTTLISCSTTSYFNLYFEPGCGMEDINNPVHNARRAVLCKVFEDVSNFINSPLTTTGNKVNIWIRNINNVYSDPNGILGVASAFYTLPNNVNNNSFNNIGGIADNEIWKTIHTGVDSYLNISTPLTYAGAGSNQAGFFYHGYVAFNFNANNIPAPFNWNTSLTATSIPTTTFDLYSAVLHEVTHALGFASLIDQNGNSKFGEFSKYYNRYDTFLKTNNSSSFLLTTSACSSMYNNGFNSSLSTSILKPNSLNCVSNTTTCLNAIKFVGTSTVPVYTPNCFNDFSSLSHFEDALFPSCTTPNGNDAYFLMCNAGNSGIIRRFLKPQERQALCSIGYSVKTTFGVASTFNGYFNYGGTVCGGISVAGVNDGINNSSQYTFIGNSGVGISLSGATILSNDTNATGFECLQDISSNNTYPTTLSATSGTSTSTITFSSSISGVHLLRYIPTNGTQKGNITYIYVNVIPTASSSSCNPVTSVCNLVSNGNFENNNNYLTVPANTEFDRACGWYNVGSEGSTYYRTNSVNNQLNVPCNTYGFQTDNIVNNQAYAGINVLQHSNISRTSTIIGTLLTSSLLPNTSYQLKFDVSEAEFRRETFFQLQAFISTTLPSAITGGLIPNSLLNTGILLTNPTFSSTTNGWETIIFPFTTGNVVASNMNRLYIGALNGSLNDPTISTSLPSLVAVGCTNAIFHFGGGLFAHYYIDNVSLVGGYINLPTSMCFNATLPNLATFLSSGVPTTGVFSGDIVTITNGIYSFTPLVPSKGESFTTTITYTFTNNLGCQVTLSDTILIINNVPTFNAIPVICAGGTVPVLPTSSTNVPAITGTWNPATISNTISGTYIFTPAAGQCASGRSVAVKVLNSNSFVANNDNFSTIFPITAIITNSVLLNDTYNGGAIPNVLPFGMINTIQAIGTAPTFAVGGVTFNANGTFTIQPNTTPGIYTYQYVLHNNCFNTPVASVNLTISNYVSGPLKKEFRFCYNSGVSASNTSNLAVDQSLYQGFTIQGQPINPNSVSITILTPSLITIPITILADGTFTIPAGTLPTFMQFYYKICTNGTNICSESIRCDVYIESTISTAPDTFSFKTSGLPFDTSSNNNVLNNDYKRVCNPITYIQATSSNVNLTPIVTNNYFAILPNGSVTPNSNINNFPIGT